MVSFVLLILGALYFYFYNSAKSPSAVNNGSPNQNNRITDSTPPAPSQTVGGGTTTSSAVYGKQPDTITTPVAPVTSPPTKPTVNFVKTDADKNIDYYTATGSKLELQLKVLNSDCWYQLDSLIDGKHKMIKQEQKSAGYSNSWSLDSSAYIRVGKADAVEITVNGTALTIGDSPNPKNIQIDLQPS
jgi:hypothetical protein